MHEDEHNGDELLSVEEAAEQLGVLPGTVSKMLREGRLRGRKQDPAREKSPWRVSRAELRRYVARRDHKARMQRFYEAGGVVGYSSDFLDRLEASPNPPEVKEQVRALFDKRELLDRAQRELYADEDALERLAELDEEARFEAEARELARRVRRAERLLDRALKILQEEDEEGA
jgi:excisionase family DNA binding protein